MRGRGFSRLRRQRVELDDALQRVKVRVFVDECGADGTPVDVFTLLELAKDSALKASALLRRMVGSKKLVARGSPPRWVYYELPPTK